MTSIPARTAHAAGGADPIRTVVTDSSELPPPLASLLEPFAQRIADIVLERMGARTTGAADPPTSEVFVTRAQARALGVETRALLRAQKSGAIEAFRPGREVLYRRSDVLALVERAKVVLESPEPCATVLPTDPFERAIAHAERRASTRHLR
jgi:hypothetical protein